MTEAVDTTAKVWFFPEYNYAAYQKLIESLHDKPVELENVGNSREMRYIWLVHIRSRSVLLVCLVETMAQGFRKSL